MNVNRFLELKRQLTDALILQDCHPNLETKLATDMLDGVVTGILLLKHRGL